MAKELRYSTEVRAEKSDRGMSLVGYAATFGQESEDLGGFREMIMPGAFARALREGQDVRCLRNHDPNFILGRSKNGTLQLKEDSRGLWFRCELDPANPEHVSTHSSVSRGDMDACSFSFVAKSQEWNDVRDGEGALYAQRKLHDVDIQDTSVVTYPAYQSTSVSARSRYFPEGEAEIRSALDGLASKRALEQRGKDEKGHGSEPKGDSPQSWDGDHGTHLEMTWDDAKSVSGQGDQSGNVKELMEQPDIKAQLEQLNPDKVASKLKGYGAWDKQELQDHSANLGRLLWIAAGDIKESGGRSADPKCETRFGTKERKDMKTKEERGIDINVQTVGMASPGFLSEDLKKIWVKAFDDAFSNAIKMNKTPKLAIPCAVSAANEAIKDMVAHEAEGSEAEPTPDPKNLKNIEDDKDPDKAIGEEEPGDEHERAHRVECEKRGVHTSAPAEVEGRCPVCRNMASECSCDCDDPNCWCQNRSIDAMDIWGDEDLLDEIDPEDRAIRTAAKESRAKVITKTVGGKHLPASAFAFVGDPNKTETWKLPVHDENHVKNALARFGQTQDIPAAKKASVLAKIKAAAKKFGIHTSEENSIDPAVETAAWERLVQIKTSL